MKALLIKDLYMAKRYCRSYLFIVGIFLLVSVFNPGQNLFFLAYPCVLAGMVSTTLLSFDERMGWTSYCGCLPYTKRQLVGEKYLLGLIVELVVWVVSLVCLALGMNRIGSFDSRTFLVLALLLFAVAMLPGAINLPSVLLLGTERGRIVTMSIVAILCVGSLVLNLQSEESAGTAFIGKVALSQMPLSVAALLAAVSVLLYALSYLFALRLYPGKIKE